MSAIVLLERATTSSEPITSDWEAPAGGAADLPHIPEMSFTYHGQQDEHLIGQGCLALEPPGTVRETRLVGFACGCRLRVPRRQLMLR